MPEIKIKVTAEENGIIFQHAKVYAEVTSTRELITATLANEGYKRIQAMLRRVLRFPTGRYQSHIKIDNKQKLMGLSDSNIIYGGWLEGIGKRNKTTRFKGYHTFSTVEQSLMQDRVALAQPIVAQLIAKLR